MTNPLISVITPSRGRPEDLAKSLVSLGCPDPRLEPMIRLDGDDPTLPEYLELLADPVFGEAHYIIGDRGRGYADLHLMVNELCAAATGEWLFLWNDDCLMRTPDWIDKIENSGIMSSTVCVLNVYDPVNLRNDLFPLVSAYMFKALGHFSLSPHNDTWVSDVANALDRHIGIPGITINHLREEFSDDTHTESQATYATSSPEYYGPEMTNLREADVDTLYRLIVDHGA